MLISPRRQSPPNAADYKSLAAATSNVISPRVLF